MGRVNTPNISETQRQELYSGFKTGDTHCFRMRCHAILLKAEGRKSKEVAKLTDMCHVSVNSWLARYKSEGIQGLYTRPGRGRKSLLSIEKDQESVLEIVKENRQRLQVAKNEWESQNNRSVSSATFRLFLKSLAENINE